MEKTRMYAIYFSDKRMAYIMAESAEEAVRKGEKKVKERPDRKINGIFRVGDNGEAIAEVDIEAVMVGMNQPEEKEKSWN